MTIDFHSVGRAARKTRPRIEILTPDAGAVMAFDVEVGVGKPGQVRPLMTVKGPGMHTFPKDIEAGQLVSVRYPGGHPGGQSERHYPLGLSIVVIAAICARKSTDQHVAARLTFPAPGNY